MAGYELRAADARAAETLLGELSDPPRALLDQLVALRAEKEKEAARVRELERLGRELDPHTGRSARTIGALIYVMLTVVGFPLTATIHSLRVLTGICFAAALFGGLATVGFARAQRSIVETAFNRRLLATLPLSLILQCLLMVGALLIQLTAAQAITLVLFQWAVATTIIAIALDQRLLFTPIAFAAGFLVAAVWPELRGFALSAANLALLLNQLWASRR
jgi:hypothetical protein